MISIYFEYSFYWLFVVAIVAAAITFFIYFKDKTFASIEKWKVILMSVLRFTFSFIIIALLLKPVFKISSIINQKPIIVLAHDNSKSVVLNKDSLFYKNDYLKNIEKLKENLKNDFDVRVFTFSDKVYVDSALNFTGSQTNISNVFSEIQSRFAGMNLGAIVLATDGIYNTGNNPAYTANIDVPIYSIALGDTVPQKDLLIKDLIHNKIAFLSNTFPLKIVVAAEKTNELESEVIVKQGNKIVYSSKFNLPESSTSKTIDIELKATQLGTQQYDVILKPLKNEITLENNIATFVIKIIDNRKKILLLSNAPHPDIAAINTALKDNPDYEIKNQNINSFNENINNYDLIILHQLPSQKNNINKIYLDIEKNKIPTLFILGTSSSPNYFNTLNAGLEISVMANSLDNASATFNNNFSAFNLDVESDFFKNLSPLKVFFGNYKFSTEAKVLIYQDINGIKTEKPLIAFIDDKDTKIGFILGDGLWKWRIDDFKNNAEHTNFNLLINRIVQYISVKRLKDKLNVDVKQHFYENEPIIINAEFYNETYEIVKNLDIILTLTNEEQQEYTYNLESFQNGYRLNLGGFSAGKYKYSLRTKFDGKSYETQGDFIVQKLNIENLITMPNHNLLYRLAEKSGGKVFEPNKIVELEQEIKNNKNITTISRSSDKLLTINDLFYIFFIILLFATCEWGLRKYFGGY